MLSRMTNKKIGKIFALALAILLAFSSISVSVYAVKRQSIIKK